MHRQGNVLEDFEVEKIKKLLSETDLDIPAIAERMGRSRHVVHSVNRKFNIRNYRGLRKWETASKRVKQSELNKAS